MLHGLSFTSPSRLLAGPALLFMFIAAISCSAGGPFSPVGAQDPEGPSRVTVPDDITDLDSEEVERRLGRLLNGEASSGLAAPDVEPTEEPDGPTLDEILDILNSATPEPGTGEIAIQISPATLAGLRDPVLLIKSPASHGIATVVAPNRILYVPDGSGDGTDTFEYELRDGDVTVVSQVMEIKS